jgi:response regulator RpfG family c-di-GMP phosphodiesterase
MPDAQIGQLKELLRNESEAGAAAEPLAEAVLERLARVGRFRDEETAEHVERMSRTCALIARGLGWSAARSAQLRAASTMHDIGKTAVPDSILRKPGRLTPEERTLIETHAQVGHDILTGSDDPVIQLAASVALTHHERVDGDGYPRGLDGEAIPIEGRIAAVADVFDALTHDRVYRSAFSVAEALAMLREGRGTQFDPAVLDAFAAVLPEVEHVRTLYPDSPDGGGIDPGFFAAPARSTRVLLIEDHEAVARGLELLLRREGLEIAGTGRSLAEARSLLERRAADVLVLDPGLQEEDGLEVVPAAKARGIRVLLYTGSMEHAAVAEMRRAGADGVASKAGSPQEFLAAVQAVARGEAYLDPRLKALPNGNASPQAALTPREREIVALLAEGLSGEEIAARLFLSPETVRTHIRNARERVGAKTRAHLVTLAAE